MTEAILSEIEMRFNEYNGDGLSSVYFGGGTPSVLEIGMLSRIMEKIKAYWIIKPNAEITLEANPEDLDMDYLIALKEMGVNRLSIGIQSFNDTDLQWMNRIHDANAAKASIENSLALGFENISIDLIFGSPTTTDDIWRENLVLASELGVNHLSCYALTVEPNTALIKMIDLGKKQAPEDSVQERQFNMAQAFLTSKGFEHYEISNYCLPGREAVHNSNYWLGARYLGLGPSAHSYDGANRYWNVSNNIKYLKLIEVGNTAFEKENLTPSNRYNEYVMTRLRTKWGVEQNDLLIMGKEYLEHFKKSVFRFIDGGQVIYKNETYFLSKNAKFYADGIASELFYV